MDKGHLQYLPKANRFSELLKTIRKTVGFTAIIRKSIGYLEYSVDNVRNVLDAGCGAGYLLRVLRAQFPLARIFGVDYCLELLKVSLENKFSSSYLIGLDLHNLPFRSNTFDIIYSIQVIEHLALPEEFIKECWRVLNPNGLLALTTPNPTGLAARILKDRWQGSKPDHISLHPPEYWRSIINKNKYQILVDGTTGLSGFDIFRGFPFAIINYIPLSMLGLFPWQGGESYIVFARKE